LYQCSHTHIHIPDDVVDGGNKQFVENSECDELGLEVERRRGANAVAEVDTDTEKQTFTYTHRHTD